MSAHFTFKNWGYSAPLLIILAMLLWGAENPIVAATVTTMEYEMNDFAEKLNKFEENPSIPKSIIASLHNLAVDQFNSAWTLSRRSGYWYAILGDKSENNGVLIRNYSESYVRIKPQIKLTISKIGVESYRAQVAVAGREESVAKGHHRNGQLDVEVVAPMNQIGQQVKVKWDELFSFDKPGAFLFMEASMGLKGSWQIEKKRVIGRPIEHDTIELIENPKPRRQKPQEHQESDSEQVLNSPKNIKIVTKVLHDFTEADYVNAYTVAMEQVAKYWTMDTTNSRLYGTYGSGAGARMKRVDTFSPKLELVWLPRPSQSQWNVFASSTAHVDSKVYANPQSFLELATGEQSMEARALFTVYGDLIDFISNPPGFEPMQIVQIVELVREGNTWKPLEGNQQYPRNPGTVPAKSSEIIGKYEKEIQQSVTEILKARDPKIDENSRKQQVTQLRHLAKRKIVELLAERYAAIGTKKSFLGPDFYGAPPYTDTPAVIKLEHVEVVFSVFVDEGQMTCKFKVLANIINTWEPSIHMNESLMSGTLWWAKKKNEWSKYLSAGTLILKSDAIEHYALRAKPLQLTLKEVQDLYW